MVEVFTKESNFAAFRKESFQNSHTSKAYSAAVHFHQKIPEKVEESLEEADGTSERVR